MDRVMTQEGTRVGITKDRVMTQEDRRMGMIHKGQSDDTGRYTGGDDS